ncbi:hypothetical protein PR001_g22803 [Phytophthora rubi]|uniref:DDE Tnp4 domain-containing protein n=2 Tax=Phytophthora rubi TaxID=129364 RepID=A0A6A3IS32_9STRA|nr:hypothetical protein PR001_g22803 [Phytophthora rubi]
MDIVRHELQERSYTQVEFVPPGVTGICQPMDVAVMKPFKDHTCYEKYHQSNLFPKNADDRRELLSRKKLLDPVYCPDSSKNVVLDSAFPCSTTMVCRILTPPKDGDIERLHPSLRSSARTLHNVITYARQAAEWAWEVFKKYIAGRTSRFRTTRCFGCFA